MPKHLNIDFLILQGQSDLWQIPRVALTPGRSEATSRRGAGPKAQTWRGLRCKWRFGQGAARAPGGHTATWEHSQVCLKKSLDT